jgi:hypothetical protein
LLFALLSHVGRERTKRLGFIVWRRWVCAKHSVDC